MNVGQMRVEHHAKVIDNVMDDLMADYKRLKKQFFTMYDRNGKMILDNDDKPAINFKEYHSAKTALSAQIGYMAQIATGQAKAILYETDIKQIKRIISRVPPEIMQMYINPPTLEVLADDGRQDAK